MNGPRGIGTGNADTLQQRARFFGYKRHYLGYCRIYLEAVVLGVFEGYVTHEEEMRSELQGVRERGEPLASWKKAGDVGVVGLVGELALAAL